MAPPGGGTLARQDDSAAPNSPPPHLPLIMHFAAIMHAPSEHGVLPFGRNAPAKPTATTGRAADGA
jgi:hypothetical protein